MIQAGAVGFGVGDEVPVDVEGQDRDLRRVVGCRTRRQGRARRTQMGGCGPHCRVVDPVIVGRMTKHPATGTIGDEGDVVAVLTVLTGRRFAYDFAAWRDWWAAADWPTAP